MLIQCLIRRTGGTVVDMPPLDEVKFKPIDATRADSPHVADVSEEQAARLFQADAKVYVPFNANAPRVKLAAPAAPAPVLPVTPIVPAAAAAATIGELAATALSAMGATTDTKPPADVDFGTKPPVTVETAPAGDTNDDGALSVRELKEAIKAGTYTPEQLREIMAKEQESDEPRNSFIAEIVKALKQ